MQNIPQQFKDLVQSGVVYKNCEDIGNKFNLHIDQVGELGAEISDIILGVSDSSKFIENIMRRLEINRDLAEKIVGEVNKEIFDVIKSKLNNDDRNKNNTHNNTSANNFSSQTKEGIEKVGDFSMEIYKDEQEINEGDIENKENIVDGIENPVPGYEKGSIQAKQPLVEPLIDHLLTTPTIQKEQKIVRVEQSTTKKAPNPGMDPYREPIK